MQGKFKCLGRQENLEFGENCCIVREPWPFFDVKGGGIRFGQNVVISAGVYILTHDHQFNKKNWRELDEIKPSDPTVIEDYVFLGVNSMIMPGCKRIGKHSVIAAGSVVTKDVPDCEIWGGNPAKCIGKIE